MNPHEPLAVRMAARLCASGGYEPTRADTDKAVLCLTDFLACALSSGGLPWSQQAVSLARKRDADKAGIIGSDVRTTLADAAFANSVLGHGLVRDDMHLGSVSHLAVVVMPTVLALAEQRTVSGPEVIAAVVAGYEAGGKLGRAVLDVDVSRLYRPTGIVGPIAAATAGARLLDLSESELKNVLAMAANLGAGYNEWAATGGSEMFFQPAIAVRNALTAIELACAGAQFSDTAIDGPAGLLASFAKPLTPSVPLPYEDTPEIHSVFYKEVPACNYAQTPAQVARDIAAMVDLDVDPVEQVVVRVTHAAREYPGCDYAGPYEHALQAKMSIQYNVAAALLTGNFSEENYRPGEQQAITQLAARVRLEVDPNLSAAYPEHQGADVEVTLRSGQMKRKCIADVMPATPELVEKRLVEAANAVLGVERADELVHKIRALATCEDAGTLARAAQISAGDRRPRSGG